MDYILQESDFDIGINKDPVSFSQAIKCNDSSKWVDAMNEELKSIDQNKIYGAYNCGDDMRACCPHRSWMHITSAKVMFQTGMDSTKLQTQANLTDYETIPTKL